MSIEVWKTTRSFNRFRRCSPSILSVSLRCLSDTLGPGEPGWEALLLDAWSFRLPWIRMLCKGFEGNSSCLSTLLPPFLFVTCFIGRVRRGVVRIAHRGTVEPLQLGYSGSPITGSPWLTSATFAS